MTEYRTVVAHEQATESEVERVLHFLPTADVNDQWVQVEQRNTGELLRAWPRPKADLWPVGSRLQF